MGNHHQSDYSDNPLSAIRYPRLPSVMTSLPLIKPRRFDRDVDGILLLDKPKGLSSNAALQQARVLYRALKAGHAGSLDPMATGMLPVCFGHATKACAFLLDARKSYRFTARLGERSDTGDADGTIVDQMAVPTTTESQVAAILRTFVGEQSQIPPMYSALKHQGQRLYDMARRGESIERAPRRITIEALALVRLGEREIEIDVRCSKGTYVRTLAEDIAVKLGTVAHLTALRRLEVDPFAGRTTYSLEQLGLLGATGLEALDAVLIPTDEALNHLPVVEVDLHGQHALMRGQSVVGPQGRGGKPGDMYRLYGPNRLFLGLGEFAGEAIQPRRLFVKSANGR
jgi:tRNA pseudouridine55 synthase